jgi:hypothetical protein
MQIVYLSNVKHLSAPYKNLPQSSDLYHRSSNHNSLNTACFLYTCSPFSSALSLWQGSIAAATALPRRRVRSRVSASTVRRWPCSAWRTRPWGPRWPPPSASAWAPRLPLLPVVRWAWLACATGHRARARASSLLPHHPALHSTRQWQWFRLAF